MDTSAEVPGGLIFPALSWTAFGIATYIAYQVGARRTDFPSAIVDERIFATVTA